jgi:hypothetical protein
MMQPMVLAIPRILDTLVSMGEPNEDPVIEATRRIGRSRYVQILVRFPRQRA